MIRMQDPFPLTETKDGIVDMGKVQKTLLDFYMIMKDHNKNHEMSCVGNAHKNRALLKAQKTINITKIEKKIKNNQGKHASLNLKLTRKRALIKLMQK